MSQKASIVNQSSCDSEIQQVIQNRHNEIIDKFQNIINYFQRNTDSSSSDVSSESQATIDDLIQSNEILKQQNNILHKMLNHAINRYYDKLSNSDWNLWDSQDIVAWICNLDKTNYAKYGDILIIIDSVSV